MFLLSAFAAMNFERGHQVIFNWEGHNCYSVVASEVRLGNTETNPFLRCKYCIDVIILQ